MELIVTFGGNINLNIVEDIQHFHNVIEGKTCINADTCGDIDINRDNLIVTRGFEKALKTPGYIKRVYLTIVNGKNVDENHFNPAWLKEFVIVDNQETEWGRFQILERRTNSEWQYLNLLENLIFQGKEREGRNGPVLSLFTNHFTFDLREGFPLLTTKRMFTRGIIEEFLFFLRGDTNTTSLSEKKIRIWEGNTSEEFIKSRNLPYTKGVMGPMYGYQWRYFGAKYEIDDDGIPSQPSGGVDQLKNIIDMINTNPCSRRIMMTVYNPIQVDEGVLYPCHSIIVQFYVEGEYLDMFCYNRSQDTLLGVPYNIASSSLLLSVVAKITNKIPRFLNMTMGDTHLYMSHTEQAKEQISRIPYSFPTLTLSDSISMDIHSITAKDFVISEYSHYSSIKADMVI